MPLSIDRLSPALGAEISGLDSSVEITPELTDEQTAIPYGTRMVQAITSINCIGGTQSVNADRRVVHITKDHLTNELAVVERTVNRVLREINTLDSNPFLMPGDAIACYDSNVHNIREVARVFNDLLSPFVALSVIFGQF